MIEVSSVTKRFGEAAALRELSAEIGPGGIYGLIGPNGSGKTTLLCHMAGAYRPDAGEVRVDGLPVWENPAARAEIFLLPDDPWIPPGAALEELARFCRRLYPAFDPEEYRRLCGIFPVPPKKRLRTLSKGLRRQAIVLLALSCRTPYLLLDEVFDGLDPVVRQLVRGLLIREVEARGLGVVIATHDLRELSDLCDHIGLLWQGQLLFAGELDRLREGYCRIQAAFPEAVDWSAAGLPILRREEQGQLVSLLVRGGAEETLAALGRYRPLFAEASPLTLEQVFIGEMEALGYDYSELLG